MSIVHHRPAIENFLAERREEALYELGQAHGLLQKAAGDAASVHAMSGRLYLSQSGWLLLDVPNALVRGVFDTLHEPGLELPLREGKLNAHITVMNPTDLEQLGGADKVTERGHSFHYSLGATKTVEPRSWKGVSKVWFVSVRSPELEALRRSYGLTSTPNNGKHEFHVTVAIKRRNVLRENAISKAASSDDNCPVCGKEYVARCRCLLGNKTCANGHDWHRCPVHGTINLGSGHGSGGGCTCPGGEKKAEDRLPGGAADNRPDSDFDPGELALGKREEKDHTNDPAIAAEIAKDHLVEEGPRYYSQQEDREVKTADDGASPFKIAPRFTPGADPSVALAAEEGFVDSFKPNPVRPGIVEQLARSAGPTGTAIYSHLPRVRALDSAVGGTIGALGGLGVEATRRLFGKKSKNSWLDYLKSMAVGGAVGVGAGNLAGDRARRYMTNTIIPYRYGQDRQKVVADGKPVQGKTYAASTGTPLDRVLPRSFKQFWDAAVLDRPAHTAMTGELDGTVLRGPGIDSVHPDPEVQRQRTREVINRNPDLLARIELMRREMGVHTDDEHKDIWARQPDGSFSLNPKNKEVGKFLPLLLGDAADKNRFDMTQDPLMAAQYAGMGAGRGGNFMSYIVGGQVPRLSVTGKVDTPFPKPQTAKYQELHDGEDDDTSTLSSPKFLATVRDRWDYTLDPKEKSYLWQLLRRLPSKPGLLNQRIPKEMVDGYNPEDTTNDKLLGQLIGRQALETLSYERPWVHQHVAFDPVVDGPDDVHSNQVAKRFKVRPLAGAGMPYPGYPENPGK